MRSQTGGQNTYLGIYFWNSGSPQLRLYKRSAGTWIQLGNSYNSGPLAAGTQLKLTAVGSTISFLQNGIARITVTDNSFTGGAPGIMSYGAATGDNWAGGTPTDTTPPSAPGTVSASAVSSSEIDLSWAAATDNIGVTGYQLFRCQGSSCTSFAQVGTASGDNLQRHQSRRGHQLQLPGTRARRGRQPRAVLEHRHRHNPRLGHVFDRRHRFRGLRNGGAAKQRR